MAPEAFHVLRLHGRTRLLYGPYVILEYADDNISMRNCILVALTHAGVLSGKQAGPIFGLRPEQVSRLRSEYRRSGPSGLAGKRAGRPAALSAEQVFQARVLAGRRLTHAGIARRLGVPRSVVTETLKRHGGPLGEEGSARPHPQRNGSHLNGTGEPHRFQPEALPRAGERLIHGTYGTVFASTMLLHAYTHHCGLNQFITQVAASVAGTEPPRDDTGLLTAMGVTASLRDRLGAGHWADHEYQTGPLLGWERLPRPAVLRRHLTQLTDRIDPVSMLSTYLDNATGVGPGPSNVFYVGDLLPARVADRARRGNGIPEPEHRENGRLQLHRYTVPALASWRIIERNATTVGFDAGGVHPRLFQQVRAAGLHWLTYRHPPLQPSHHRPTEHMTTRFGQRLRLCWTDEVETSGGDELGAYRQITMYDGAHPALQVLTSDRVTGADALVREIIDRWAAVATEGDCPSSAHAPAVADGALVGSGTPLRPGHALLEINGNRIMLGGDNRPGAAPPGVRTIRQTTRQMLEALFERMVANAELWLVHRLNALTDDAELCWKMAVTLLRGTEGRVAYGPAGITVTLRWPDQAFDVRALEILLHQLNNDPARVPGDPRPITYVLGS